MRVGATIACWSRWRLVLAAVSGVLACSSPAFGQSIRLDYRRSAAAEACPTAESMRAGVKALMGRDPFSPDATSTVICELDVRDEQFVARIELNDHGSPAVGARELVAPDCEALARTVRVTLTIVISGLGTAPATDPAAVTDPPNLERVPHLDRRRDNTTEVGFTGHALAGVAGSFSNQSRVGMIGVLGIGVRRRGLSAGLELHAAPETETAIEGGGRVTTRTIRGALVPCAHKGAFGGCLLLLAGRVSGRGHELDMARSVQTPNVSVGGRVAWEFDLSAAISLRAHLDLAASLTRTTLRVGPMEVWETPRAEATAGIVILGRAP